MKMYAKAKLVSKSQVTAKLTALRDTYVNGMIFVEIPELGFEGQNLILCRYGLSVPFLKVKVGQPLWVEPTIGELERFIYTGFAEPMIDSYDDDDSVVLFDSENLFIKIKEDGNVFIKNEDNEVEVTPTQTKSTKDIVHPSTRTAFSDGVMTAFGPSISIIPNAHPVP